MNWLSVTLTVALTAPTWLGRNDQTPLPTPESALVDPSASVDTAPVLSPMQAPNNQGGGLVFDFFEFQECAEDCPGKRLNIPADPVVRRFLNPDDPMDVYGWADPFHAEVDEEWNEHLFIRKGTAYFGVWYNEAPVVMDAPWRDLRVWSNDDQVIAWTGADNIVVGPNGWRLTFAEAGEYTLTATVSATYSLEVGAVLTCQNCLTGCWDYTTILHDVPTPPYEQEVKVTVVEAGGLTVTNTGNEINDGVTAPQGVDRKAYLRERSVEAGMVVATATPIPAVSDEVLESLGWNFGGGQPVQGESPLRKRQAPTQTAAINTFSVGWGDTPDIIRVAYVVGIDILEGGTVVTGTKNSVIGKGMNMSARLVPVGLPFGMESSKRWSIQGNRIKNYVADDNTGVVELLGGNDLTGSASIKFYWVESDNGVNVYFACSVKGISVTGAATYDIKKPTVIVSIPTRNLPNIDTPATRIRLGTHTDITTVGIVFKAVTSWAGTGTEGSTQFLQTVCPSRYHSVGQTHANATYHRYVDSTPRLDTTYPYHVGVVGETNTEFAGDSPGKGILSNYLTCDARDENFWMYVMVKPNFGDAIFVPTHVVHWRWNILATKITSTGVWGHGLVALPSIAGPAATAQHPSWTKNVKNADYEAYKP